MVARSWSSLRVFLEMIKFEHSIFALPFAMIGMMWGSLSLGRSAWPGWWVFGWVIVAMVSCRSAAMAFNRIADREIDALNPRTKMRALPANLIQLKSANLLFLASCIIFFVSAWQLNTLAVALSPLALGVTLFYSWTKRFTPLCHLVLGLSLGFAPGAAWVAATGSLNWQIVPMVAAVLCWTAGFDIIYALQDEDFDRDHGLRSIPQTLGKRRALAMSRGLHFCAVALLAVSGFLNHGGPWFTLGVLFAAAMLTYEQSLVKPTDLSKVNMAFFTLNGFVSLGVFGFALVDVLTR